MRAGPPPSTHGGPRVSRCCRSQPSGDPALTHRAGYAPRPGSSLLRQAEAHLAPGPPCFAPPWPCSPASSLGPGICPFRVLGKASCTRRATPSPPSLPDPRPRSVLTGQRPHLPGPGRFRSRRRGPAWRAPGRVRPGPPWAFAPSLMPRTTSGSLGTAACREALGSLLFSGACVSRTWCCSMPGPSRGPAHQRQLATGCPGP